MFFRIFIASMGVIKSDNISQLTGKTAYLFNLAIFSTSEKVGKNCIKSSFKIKLKSSEFSSKEEKLTINFYKQRLILR